jgi:hypothetical protein
MRAPGKWRGLTTEELERELARMSRQLERFERQAANQRAWIEALSTEIASRSGERREAPADWLRAAKSRLTTGR